VRVLAVRTAGSEEVLAPDCHGRAANKGRLLAERGRPPRNARSAQIAPSETLVAPHREWQAPGAQGPFAMADLYSGQSKPGIAMSRAIVISLVACALSNAAFAETIKLACHFTEEVSFPSDCRSCHQSH